MSRTNELSGNSGYLTPEKRAEKIISSCGNDLDLAVDLIAAAIREAEEEARKDEWDTKIKTWSNPFKVRADGFRAGAKKMREEAAKVTENFNRIPIELEDYLPMIATDIRALPIEEPK